VQAFAELASELIANGHKALVFSQFVDFLQLLREPLDEAGIATSTSTAATPAAERSRRVAAFQAGEGDLFLISLKAGGFGLNLTAADYVVITDPWWNPAAEDQAMGRAHRIGQQRPVTVYRLVTRGTIEERIVELHHDKRALADSILAEGEASALPSTEDLVALIRGE
jgi:SNF2 family DNA or RNA helicase